MAHMLLIWGTVVNGLMAVLAILATNTNVIPIPMSFLVTKVTRSVMSVKTRMKTPGELLG